MIQIELINLSKSFISRTQNKFKKFLVLDKINLNINKGEFVAIVGPNGCGKTTLLKIIAGIERYEHGKILIDGKNPANIKKGFIFQNYSDSLFPWLSCINNILFPYRLKANKNKLADAKKRLKRLLDILKINLPLNSFPYEISGGQQQLVAILRALIYEPDIILMDEPFNSLSQKTRLFMEKILLKLRDHHTSTIVFVSHDIEEAILLADRVVILGELPARIIKIVNIPFKYPRNMDLIKTKEFFDIKKKCLKILNYKGFSEI